VKNGVKIYQAMDYNGSCTASTIDIELLKKGEKQLDTSGSLATIQYKTSDHVENSRNNYRYSTISFVFCMFTHFFVYLELDILADVRKARK
jgi:phospholipid N-methyltransferase